jgi:NADH-quinone oxidoreductase subunit L
MGGLLKKTPVTACVMIFAFFAIVGFPGFAGFWSKDLILEKLVSNGPVIAMPFALGGSVNVPVGMILYVVGLATAVITAVYMGRLIIMTFFGEYRGSKESEAHIHEAPAVMLIPMVVLTFGSIFAGYLWADMIGITFFKDSLAAALGGAEAVGESILSAQHVNPVLFAVLGTLAALLGMFIAWRVYANKKIPTPKDSGAPEGSAAAWTFVWDYIHVGFVFPVRVIAWICDVVVDKFLQAFQWTLGAIGEILGDGASTFQVRRVRLQLALSITGVALIVLVALFAEGIVGIPDFVFKLIDSVKSLLGRVI